MPIHDWTHVDAGIFHDFHHSWISEISRSLNRGLLPPDHYALVQGGVVGTVSPPKVQFRLRTEPEQYAAKANAVTIRHQSDHRVVAVVEIVSPGNKDRHGLSAFVRKAVELLRGGVHLLILDLFPPGPHDPQGIHKAIWDEFLDSEFTLPAAQPLTLVAYLADRWPEAFIEPIAVGAVLPEMPVFLSLDVYVPLPLEPTYQGAWEAVPAFWREVVMQGPGQPPAP